MGNIFKALVKSYKEGKTTSTNQELEEGDLRALLQYNQYTNKLNIHDKSIIKNPGTLHRLLSLNMIKNDGELTLKALNECKILAQSASGVGNKENPINAKQSDRETRLRLFEDTLLNREIFEHNERIDRKNISFEQDTQKSSPNNENFILSDKGIPANPQLNESDGRFHDPTPGLNFEQDKIDKNVISLHEPKSFEAEQFRLLRTNILYPASCQIPHSILVTSTVPGEGKSFVASNLAVSVANNVDWNVLLIDCDLRKPALHRLFGYKNVPGLSEYLSKKTPLSKLLIRTNIKRLSILAAGNPPDKPSELISSALMAELLLEVKNRYENRLIIVDAPPASMASEVGMIANYVDGIIVVVKYRQTSLKTFKELIAKLGKEKVLGAVINNLDKRSSKYQTKYYSKYYCK